MGIFFFVSTVCFRSALSQEMSIYFNVNYSIYKSTITCTLHKKLQQKRFCLCLSLIRLINKQHHVSITFITAEKKNIICYEKHVMSHAIGTNV